MPIPIDTFSKISRRDFVPTPPTIVVVGTGTRLTAVEVTQAFKFSLWGLVSYATYGNLLARFLSFFFVDIILLLYNYDTKYKYNVYGVEKRQTKEQKVLVWPAGKRAAVDFFAFVFF